MIIEGYEWYSDTRSIYHLQMRTFEGFLAYLDRFNFRYKFNEKIIFMESSNRTFRTVKMEILGTNVYAKRISLPALLKIGYARDSAIEILDRYTWIDRTGYLISNLSVEVRTHVECEPIVLPEELFEI